MSLRHFRRECGCRALKGFEIGSIASHDHAATAWFRNNACPIAAFTVEI